MKVQECRNVQMSGSLRDFILVVEVSLNEAVQRIVLLEYTLHRR